ncbi:MAG: type II secretion system protein [Candidatus Omnitrophica bacterium]|nr:type II secretion system protein [Candidatus Omnitrophota bacterium]
MQRLPPIFRRRRQNNCSFTLVELLIVATIFSFVALGIAGSLAAGLKVWDRAKNTDFSRGNVLFTLEGFARSLRQSINFKLIDFEGKSTELSFPTLSGNHILKVTYKFDASLKKFIREETDLKAILVEKDAAAATQKELFEIDNLSFEYYYFDTLKAAYTWKNAWEKAEGIFTAVRLRLTIKDEEFSKTVFMPFSL